MTTALPDPPPVMSYAKAAASSAPRAAYFSPSVFEKSNYKGEPAIILPSAIESSMAAPFKNSVVGKFSQGRPALDAIRKFLCIQNYKGNYCVGLMDNKHAIIRFELDEDYIRIFSKPVWQVGYKPMRILKWSSSFHVDKEPSIIPLWISLPKLPIHLMNEGFIFALVSTFGHPLRLDAATIDLRKPSVAKVQVEIDILRPPPKRVWVQREDGDSFWQSITWEDEIPSYCTYCWHLGHTENDCFVKHPVLCQQPKAKSRKQKQQEYKLKIVSQENTSTDATQIVQKVGGANPTSNEPTSTEVDIGGAQHKLQVGPSSFMRKQPNFEPKDHKLVSKGMETSKALPIKNSFALLSDGYDTPLDSNLSPVLTPINSMPNANLPDRHLESLGSELQKTHDNEAIGHDAVGTMDQKSSTTSGLKTSLETSDPPPQDSHHKLSKQLGGQDASANNPKPSFKEQLIKPVTATTPTAHLDSALALRPIIQSSTHKPRSFTSMGMFSDSESNKKRMEKDHLGLFGDQKKDLEYESYYTEDEDSGDDMVILGDEPPSTKCSKIKMPLLLGFKPVQIELKAIDMITMNITRIHLKKYTLTFTGTILSKLDARLVSPKNFFSIE